jgi:transcriptional regulator with PAS, ATPase and Fis domain
VGVLLCGERGTGKSTLAQRIHDRSGRRGDLVEASAANVPEGLIESFLAGHTRGSFTGAHADRRGVLERAHHGTLFVDEIGEASPGLQAALLQRIDGTTHRLGSERAVTFDVRLIAATNADLPAMMEAGRFRRDLYDRIPIRVWLKPLRERPGEIDGYATQCLAKYAPLLGFTEPVYLSEHVRRVLRNAPLPGNIRELIAVLMSAMVVAHPRPEILHTDLPPSIRGSGSAAGAAVDDAAAVRWALTQTQGNQTRAAKLLGVTRQTVRNRLRRTGTGG